MYQLPDLASVAPDWAKLLSSPQIDQLLNQIQIQLEKEQVAVYPAPDQVYRAFLLTPPQAVRVVIVGQDPYHGPGQANGLAFSVNPGQSLPPSLRNIFKELAADLNVSVNRSTDLSDWARQGVLLLNRILTVRARQAASHQALAWDLLTDQVIQVISQDSKPKVFILWGNKAQTLERLIDRDKHLVIKSSHPSPLSAYRGFLGSRPFSKVNQFLKSQGQPPIQWA